MRPSTVLRIPFFKSFDKELTTRLEVELGKWAHDLDTSRPAESFAFVARTNHGAYQTTKVLKAPIGDDAIKLLYPVVPKGLFSA